MTEQEAWEASGIEGFGMTMVPRREVWRLAWAAAKGEPERLDSDAIKMFPKRWRCTNCGEVHGDLMGHVCSSNGG